MKEDRIKFLLLTIVALSQDGILRRKLGEAKDAHATKVVTSATAPLRTMGNYSGWREPTGRPTPLLVSTLGSDGLLL